ncbi:unnamed protein product [Caenorhabditis bovis]|uniref:Protein JTB n=1 Tax=Caenorhabditis bovis TaxID=2654633 RepID=A0A8S1F5X1_9PELO|nr:unnamed protein product [Caenorhabditis bovis]
MVDCSSKQIFTFVIALLGFSILIFFIEEYTEEHEMQSEMEMRKAYYENEHKLGSSSPEKTTTKYPPSDCWKYEKTEIISPCAPCKEFEMKAIKADHCISTGFYTRVNCTKSKITVLRPCQAPKESRQKAFNIFSIINLLILVSSYFAAVERKKILDQYAYSRVAQNF